MNNNYGFEVVEDIAPRYEDETDAFEINEEESWGDDVSPTDALILSINKYRKIVPDFMEQVTGLSFHNITEMIGGTAMFQDPSDALKYGIYNERRGWVLREQYLSGNVRERYEKAVEAEKRLPGEFKTNIDSLGTVMGRHVPFSDIHSQLTIWGDTR